MLIVCLLFQIYPVVKECMGGQIQSTHVHPRVRRDLLGLVNLLHQASKDASRGPGMRSFTWSQTAGSLNSKLTHPDSSQPPSLHRCHIM